MVFKLEQLVIFIKSKYQNSNKPHFLYSKFNLKQINNLIILTLNFWTDI